MHTSITVVLALTECVPSFSTAETPDTTQQPHVAPADPSGVADFARLRTEYGDRKDFFEICERNRPLERFIELVNGKGWEQVLAISDPWLQKCPIDIDAHLVTAIALKELGRVAESDHHLRWFRGLVDSIFASGDGRTPSTAFVVISVPEEYSVLRVLRMRRTSQALMRDRIDELTVESDKGVRGVIYFNPAAHFCRMDEQLRKRQ